MVRKRKADRSNSKVAGFVQRSHACCFFFFAAAFAAYAPIPHEAFHGAVNWVVASCCIQSPGTGICWTGCRHRHQSLLLQQLLLLLLFPLIQSESSGCICCWKNRGMCVSVTWVYYPVCISLLFTLLFLRWYRLWFICVRRNFNKNQREGKTSRYDCFSRKFF